MGCWNETCGLTQNTINAGEKVYAVIILNNSSVQKSCYGDGVSAPMSFVIKAQYNDCGCIENAVDDFSSRSALALFNQYYKDEKLVLTNDVLKEAQQNAKSGYGESGFTEEDGYSDIETLFKNIERGYVSLKTSDYTGTHHEQSIYFMLFGADELETMWESINYSEDYDLKTDSWINVKSDIEDFISEVIVPETPKMDKLQIREALKDKTLSEEKQEELYELMFSLSESNRPWGGDNNYKSCVSTLTRYESVNTDAFRKLHYILNGTYKKEDHKETVQCIAEFIMLLKVMMAFRKTWYPQGHSTQYDSFDLVLDYTERFLRKMYKKRHAMVEDGRYEDGFPQVIGAIPIFEEGKMKCDS